MIKIETRDGVICIRPVGDLDWESATALRHAVHDVLGSFVRVEIDLDDVASIDAVGISALVGSVRLIRSMHGEVRVSNMPQLVRSRVETLGLDPRCGGAEGPGEAA